MSEQELTLAEQYHRYNRAQDLIEERILEAFEKFEPAIYDSLDFSIGADDYDNSIEIYFKNDLPYPYEPSNEVRKEIYALGFAAIYWNFKDGTPHGDEIRNYEPRHSKDHGRWIPNTYGYVDERFDQKHWEANYNFRLTK